MISKYDTILFDVDDTLLDFKQAENKAFLLTADAFGIVCGDGFYKEYSAINESLWLEHQKGNITTDRLCVERFRILFENYGIKADPEEVNSRYMESLGSQAIMFDDTYESCKRLSEKCRLYMITNAVPYVHRRRMKDHPLAALFCDMFISGEIGYVKPSVGFFSEVGKRIPGFDKAGTLVAGDSYSSDLEGALKSGIDCCYVNRFSKELPESIVPRYTVKDLRELCDILGL